MKKNKKNSKKNGMVENVRLAEVVRFSNHPQNRIIRDNHVDEIKNCILSNGIEQIPTIIVSIKTNNIVDGHHRQVAIADLMKENKINPNLTIGVQWRYLETLEDELAAIKDYQMHSKAWAPNDFFESFKQVNENYQRLDSFISSCARLNKRSTRVALAIIFGKTYSQKKFNDGQLILTEDDINDGLENYMQIDKLLTYFTDPEPSSISGRSKKINIEEFALAWINWKKTTGCIMDFSDVCYEIRTHSKMYNAMPKTSRMYFTIIFNRVMAKVIERQSKKTATM